MIDPGWIIVGGAMVTWPVAAKVILNDFANHAQSLRDRSLRGSRDSEPLIGTEDIVTAVGLGLLCAVVWPIAWLFGLGMLVVLFTGRHWMMPHAEKERLARQELKELRAKVKELEIKGGDLL